MDLMAAKKRAAKEQKKRKLRFSYLFILTKSKFILTILKYIFTIYKICFTC